MALPITGEMPAGAERVFMWSVKEIQAAFALTIAALLSVWAMLLPPQGDIEENMLILIAQFLVFAATLLGVGGSIERILRRFKK